ncbi:hypothetical protein MTR62_08690 [Novosphingobium sp. 1949]|uniref:Haem-binding uptake Tiki superfamily ChaN domain-containing protein n=1 Tax=Novosphingobium organovorum TaxID=2930092 RepID=A0ABT0BCI0_9SPHN|nr:hypothetical protein [Novosphingobium organovorum]MCJ2182767.1 hypothetical protein [Novosphingobium organovorum]
MRLVFAGLSAAGLLAAAGGAAGAEAPETHDGGAEDGRRSACHLPEGWEALAARRPDFVVLGELHGTAQAPAFLENTACALAAQGKRVLVAIEMDAALDARLQAAWALDQSGFVAALGGPDWKGTGKGVISQAVLGGLIRLHAQESAGAAIRVVAFNGVKDAAQGASLGESTPEATHEAAQARNIAEAARGGHYDLTLVLVGNVHASRQPIVRPGIAYKPMVMHLVNSGSVIALDMRYASGSAWFCQLKAGVALLPGVPIPTEQVECGDHDCAGNAGEEAGAGEGPPAISLEPVSGARSGYAYDGTYWAGAIRGSPPAFAPM